MKTFLSLLLLGISLTALPQEDQLPLKVESAFKMKYPGLKMDGWGIVEGLYSIDFSKQGTTFSAVISEDGTWLETSEIISDFEVPAAVQDYIKKNYPAGSVSYSEKVEKNDGSHSFRVNFYDREVSYILESDLNGKNIRVRAIEEEAGSAPGEG